MATPDRYNIRPVGACSIRPSGHPVGKGTPEYLRPLPQCYGEDKAVGMHGPPAFALLTLPCSVENPLE
jgi:hypothetical protein